jgi:hypothetical protein
MKLKIDLTNAAQVAAMAAFFNSLNENPAVTRRPYETLEKAEERMTLEKGSIPQPEKIILPLSEKAQENIRQILEEVAEPTPCDADRSLSFAELKAKFPSVRAKGRDAFLEKLGLAPEEETSEEEEEEEEEETTEGEITLMQVKTMLSKKVKAHRTEIKAKLTSTGAHNMEQLKEKDYADFYNFMAELD